MSGKNSKQNKICQTIPSKGASPCSFIFMGKPLQLVPNCYGGGLLVITAESISLDACMASYILPSNFA